MAGIFNTVEPWIDESRILEMLENVSIEDKLIVEFFLLGYEKEKDTLLKILGREFGVYIKLWICGRK